MSLLSILTECSGRIPHQSQKPNAQATQAQSRLNRRNLAKQTQLNKRHALIDAQRLFNGVDGAPRIVTVLPLCDDVSPRDAVWTLAKSLGEEVDDVPEEGVWKRK